MSIINRIEGKNTGKVITLKEIAEATGTNYNYVSQIACGSKVSHGDKALAVRRMISENILVTRTITTRQIHMMESLKEQGYSNEEIAHKVGVSNNSVLRHIGEQDKELTALHMKLAGEKRAEKNAARIKYVADKKRKQQEEKLAEFDRRIEKIATSKAVIQERVRKTVMESGEQVKRLDETLNGILADKANIQRELGLLN